MYIYIFYIQSIELNYATVCISCKRKKEFYA